MRGYKYIIFILALLMSADMWAQYNPTNPAEPGVYYTLTLQATPSGGGSFNIGTNTSYSEGSTINLRAYSNSNFSFSGWEQDGEVISTSSSFTYTMPARNVKLTAHYVYNPGNPAEPTEPSSYSTLLLKASPSSGGYFNIQSGNRYEVGTSVNLRAYTNSYYTFKEWTENGNVISTSASFQYVMKEGNPELVAHFDYSPSNPAEPSEPRLYHKLFLNSNPPSGGYFNIESGNTYQEGSSVSLRAYSNQSYSFNNWSIGDSVISTNYALNYLMPNSDITLMANYTYNPSVPGEPSTPTTEQASIYGMTENGVRGQTIYYPVFLENSFSVKGMAIDIMFPQGFSVQTDNISLSGRVTGQEMNVKDLGSNLYRFTLLGEDSFKDNNGKLFEVPVSIPEDAQMGQNYPVVLTHGVVYGADGSQTAVSVRSGNIYVEKISEDGLYAKFSYDKLLGRVKFTNLSSDKAVSYLWDFGDGTTSTEKDPLHVYSDAGYYEVKLTVTGQIDTDIAEQTVLINDKSNWRVDGTFYLTPKEQGVRYFTSFEQLLSFLDNATLSGSLKIAVQGSNSFSLSLYSENIERLKRLQEKLEASNFFLSFVKHGDGSIPVVSFGEENEAFNREFVDFFMTFGQRISCEDVITRLWTCSMDIAKLKELSSQTIHSGERTNNIDFSLVSTDLNFQWNLTSQPFEGVSGFLTTGSQNIPSMTIVNEGDGTCQLVYHVVATRDNETFCEFDVSVFVTPSLVGLFTSLSPSNGSVFESNVVTLSWNSIRNAVYDVYLWDVKNVRPSTPIVSGIDELRYTSQGFCQNGHSYKWQVVARNEGQTLASDTMYFSVRSLPNLHIVSLDCSEAVAGMPMTVKWKVRNDGSGTTGETEWKDYVWLVPDLTAGTSMTGSKLLATVGNVASLAPGESYENTVNVTLEQRIYGNYDIVVTSNMYGATNLDLAITGGILPRPYQPETSYYGFLKAKGNTSYPIMEEEGEKDGISDNFFYKRINIAVPPLADIQVPKVVVTVDNSDYSQSADGVLTYTGNGEGNYYAIAAVLISGQASNTAFYSGKKVKVTATIENKGGADIESTRIRNLMYISSTPDMSSGKVVLLASGNEQISLKAGESATIVFGGYIPIDWHGDAYFVVLADVDDAVYELANTENNKGVSDKVDVLLTPGADLEPYDLSVPSQVSSGTSFDVRYSVRNIGPGIPYVNSWKDKVYISSKNTGVDETAVCIGTFNRTGTFNTSESSGILIAGQNTYVGDAYSNDFSVKVNRSLPTGTYYIYVVVDANDNVFEYDGEANNVLMSGPVILVEPDLTAELISVSEDTLVTYNTVAVSWKVKNNGRTDIINATLKDGFFASSNAYGTDAIKIADVSNTVSIVSGGEKLLRANITIPKSSSLNGKKFFFVKTNIDSGIAEADLNNNSSEGRLLTFEYVANGNFVIGMNLSAGSLNSKQQVSPGEEVSLSYTITNNGTLTVDKDVSQEVFFSKSENMNSAARTCSIIGSLPNVNGLKPGESVTSNIKFTVPSDMKGGQNYIFVVINGNNALTENRTADNTAKWPVFVDGNLPNISIADMTVPSTIMTSTPTEISWTLTNTGSWDAGVLNCELFLSVDSRYSRDDQKLAAVVLNQLTKGATEAMNTSIVLDDDVSGNKHLILRVTPNSRYEEMQTEIADKSQYFSVIQSPLPDLTISDFSADGEWRSGQSVNISALVRNIGDDVTHKDKWADVFYLAEGNTLNIDKAVKLGAKTHVGRLEQNGTYQLTTSVNIPEGLKGYYMLFAVTNGTDAMEEKNKNNNQAKMMVYVEDKYDTPSDLTVHKIQAPARIVAGETITLSYTLANEGENIAKGELHDVLYMSTDNQWDINDVMVGVVTDEISLEPGNETVRTVTGRITNMPEGTYYLIVRTNSTHGIAETDYDNNMVIQSTACNVEFARLTLGSSVTVNTSGMYKLPIYGGMDGKTIGLYLNTPEDVTAGLYTSYESVPSTARYERAATDLEKTEQEVLIPTVKEGTYYILAQDNAAISRSLSDFSQGNGNSTQNHFSLVNGFVVGTTLPAEATTTMTLTAREVQFGATTLSIKEGGSNGWLSTEIHGALLDSIMDFRLVREGDMIPAESITFYDQTSTKATFNLNDVATGSYDVISELPDGTLATLPDGFKVIPGTNVALGVKLDAVNHSRVDGYAPVNVAYANGGNTDIVIRELLLTITGGYLSKTIEGFNEELTELHIKPDVGQDNRGFVTISPGMQETVNYYFKQTSNQTRLNLYIVK